jgi:hypothetical protein
MILTRAKGTLAFGTLHDSSSAMASGCGVWTLVVCKSRVLGQMTQWRSLAESGGVAGRLHWN